jgi:hypothetical protein
MTSRERLLLRVFSLWTIWVWGTRIWNAISDDNRSFGFKAVHVALALVSVVLAIAAWVVVSRVARRARTEPRSTVAV